MVWNICIPAFFSVLLILFQIKWLMYNYFIKQAKMPKVNLLQLLTIPSHKVNQQSNIYLSTTLNSSSNIVELTIINAGMECRPHHNFAWIAKSPPTSFQMHDFYSSFYNSLWFLVYTHFYPNYTYWHACVLSDWCLVK